MQIPTHSQAAMRWLCLQVKLELQEPDHDDSGSDSDDEGNNNRTTTRTVTLHTDGAALYFCTDPEGPQDNQAKLRIAATSPRYDRWVLGDFPWSSGAQAQAFKQALAQQIEPLLYQAHRLRLEPLVERLHGFIAGCCAHNDAAAGERGILYGVLESVFTDRVLGAVLPGDAGEEERAAFIEQALTCPCSLVNAESMCQLLRPVRETYAEYLSFEATLTQDFMGSRRGAKVPVMVDLLEGGYIKIGHVKLPAQLLVGRAVPHHRDYRLVMTGRESDRDSSDEDSDKGSERGSEEGEQ